MSDEPEVVHLVVVCHEAPGVPEAPAGPVPDSPEALTEPPVLVRGAARRSTHRRGCRCDPAVVTPPPIVEDGDLVHLVRVVHAAPSCPALGGVLLRYVPLLVTAGAEGSP